MKPKYLRAVVIVCVGVLIMLSLWAFVLSPTTGFFAAPVATVEPEIPIEPPPVELESEPEPLVQTIRFAAAGDNLIHDGLYLQARKRAGGDGYDFAALYENVANFFTDYDVNWINQETLISDEFAPSSYPMFCSPTQVARHLYEIGFRVFALSNNHSYDKHAAGIASTLSFWETMPDDTVYTGFYSDETAYENITLQTVNGITLAYLAYTEHTNGLPTPQGAVAHVVYTSQTNVIEAQIKAARIQADAVIVSVHMGTENSHAINNAQTTLAQNMADWGADVIIGTHPHVVQPIAYFTAAETGKQVPFIYSLGNFVSTQAQADNLIGLVATFDIIKTTMPTGEETVEISNLLAHPLIMHYDSNYNNARVYWVKDYTPELAATHGNRNVTVPYIQKVLQESIDAEFLQQ